jgi:hypothetical protein
MAGDPIMVSMFFVDERHRAVALIHETFFILAP